MLSRLREVESRMNDFVIGVVYAGPGCHVALAGIRDLGQEMR
jgi:hypothetical protein